jgi:hypothetical protein
MIEQTQPPDRERARRVLSLLISEEEIPTTRDNGLPFELVTQLSGPGRTWPLSRQAKPKVPSDIT